MSNKIKSLLIILAVFSFLSLGAAFDVNEKITSDVQFVDNPIIPGPDTDGAPIIPPPDVDIQFVDNPIIPGPDTDGAPIIPAPDLSNSSDIQLVDNPVIPAPDEDGIIFPNPVPPTTSVVVNSVAQDKDLLNIEEEGTNVQNYKINRPYNFSRNGKAKG